MRRDARLGPPQAVQRSRAGSSGIVSPGGIRARPMGAEWPQASQNAMRSNCSGGKASGVLAGIVGVNNVGDGLARISHQGVEKGPPSEA